MRQCGSHYKLIMVGDASMAPYELHMGGHWSAGGPDAGLRVWSGCGSCATTSPTPCGSTRSRGQSWRGTTIEDIGEVIEMFPLTVDGLTEAMALLNRGVRR